MSKTIICHLHEGLVKKTYASTEFPHISESAGFPLTVKGNSYVKGNAADHDVMGNSDVEGGSGDQRPPSVE